MAERLWFKLTTDILDDPKLDRLSGNDFRTYIRLLALLKREGSEDGSIRLGDRALRYVAVKQQTRYAKLSVSRLEAVGLLSTTQLADGLLTASRKWAELQGRGVQSRVDKSRVDKITQKREQSSRSNPQKRKTECPEKLTAEQWSQVHAWRDRKHPELTNAELERQWEDHADWYIGNGTPRKVWVRSFYSWLRRNIDKSAVGGGKPPPRPTPAVVKAGPKPPPPTAEDNAETTAIGVARRSKHRRAL